MIIGVRYSMQYGISVYSGISVILSKNKNVELQGEKEKESIIKFVSGVIRTLCHP